MSWAETKIINSDFTTPLDIQQTLFNISMFGSTAINGSDIDTVYRLLQSGAFYTNELAM